MVDLAGTETPEQARRHAPPPAAAAVRPLDEDTVGQVVLRGCKRAVDVVVAATLMTLLLPLFAAIAVLVRLDSPGPVFHICDRVGYRGRPLRMRKFRKMTHDAAGASLTTADDERFTRLGRLLSKYKLDELPQLWHVLVGEMSLVGPRPESPEFVQLYPRDYHDHILQVRPGIIGFSQIAFAQESRILDPRRPASHYRERILPQKVALDRMYAAHLSVHVETRILLWAFVTVVLRQPVAVDRASGAMHLRRR